MEIRSFINIAAGGIEWREVMAVENPVLYRLERLGGRAQPLWLYTLLTVGDLERYPLWAWNEALSQALGHRVSCPSYRALVRRLEEAVRVEN